MEKLCKPEQCTGCGACANICPTSGIKMEQDGEGFLYPVICAERCVDCCQCNKVCPVLFPPKWDNDTACAFAAINKDENVRFASTSGGIFTLLCQWILEQDGVIFGAAYDEQFRVVHQCIDTLQDLAKLRGAKYAQSELGNSFQQVEKFLQDGKHVLFSGTPCQIGGLNAFLGKKWERLILVDLICHGVPSPKVWDHYIKYRNRLDAKDIDIQSINLRSKETGWPGYSIRFVYSDDTVYSAVNSQDPFLRGFVGDLYLRPSCYNCRFKGTQRASDFTLGDYWGVWNQLPDFNDGKGTSLVLLHSEKAVRLWKQLSSNAKVSAVAVDTALCENPSALRSAAMTEKRAHFFSRFEKEDFCALIDELHPRNNKSIKANLLKRAYAKLHKLLTKN